MSSWPKIKVVLMIIGASVISVIVLGVSWALIFGQRQDKESQAIAEKYARIAGQSWDYNAIKPTATKEFLATVPDSKWEQLASWFRDRLGAIQKISDDQGTSYDNFNNGVLTVSAHWKMMVTFQKANGTIDVYLQKESGQWKLMGLNVQSEALLPNRYAHNQTH